MSLINVQTSDTFEQWRVKTNNISGLVGDIAVLATAEGNLVTALNNVKTRIDTAYSNIGTMASLTGGESNLVAAINNIRAIDIGLALTGEVTGSGVHTDLGNASIALTITNGAVVTAKIADSAVTTAKIADANVTTIKIADSNVTTAKIADSGVTTAKIANDNVTAAKLKSTVTLQILNSAGSALKTLYGAGA